MGVEMYSIYRKFGNLFKSLLFHFFLLIFANQTVHAASIYLIWDENEESDLWGYRIYHGTSFENYGSPTDAGKLTSFELSGLIEGRTYYIALTAYDTSNNESEKTDEVSGIAQSLSVTSTTTTTITIPSNQREYCSTDPTLILHGGIPEEGTMSVNLPDNLSNAVSASLFLTLFDPDSSGEGYIYINNNDPIDLPVGNYDSAVHSFDVPINIDWLVQGENSFRFTHVATWGYEVRELCVRVEYQNITTTIPLTSTSIPEIATTTITGTTTSVVSGTTTILPDTIPLSGTITINDGDSATYSRNVTLTLFATNDNALVENTATVSQERELGEGALMSFSNDNKEWSDLEPYSTTKTWNLSPGEGDKTVFVQFRDPAGNWMIEPAYDQIVLEESQIICEDPQKLQPISISASSESSSFRTKDKVADGNLRTSWSPAAKVSWNNEFITLDLGEVKQVDRINMYASKLFNLDFLPLNFQIQISSDNTNWEDIYTEKNYNLQSTRSDSWDIDSYEARYIRIYITKAKTFLFFFYLVQIAEIEVYGCDIPEQNFASGDEDKKSEDNRTDETGDVIESNQGIPSVPGKPVITFY
jgi:hypothetical protein